MNQEKFLAQSYKNAWADFDYICTHDNTVKWDWIIITASNNRQAEAYQLQIDKRLEEKRLPSNTRFVVIPDLDDERIGSGGATLNVLYYLAEQIGIENVSKQRILLLHSGGDSKRIPQYSACGKLFAPVPRVLPNGKKSTLFDELIITAAGIPARTGFGMLVLPSDTELLFNPLQLDLLSCDAAGLSMKASIEEGTEHGVFLQGENSSDHRNKDVARFLHKQSEDVLRLSGAVDNTDCVDIDTGCIWMGKKVIGALLQLVCVENHVSEEKLRKFVNPKVCLSFYADFIYPLAEKSTLEEYYRETPENVFSEELKECRTLIWNQIHSYKLSLVKMIPARYIHFGMTHEMFDLFVWHMEAYSFLGWEKRIITNAASGRVFNSYIHPDAVVADDTFIEDCVIGKDCNIGGGTVLSGIDLVKLTIPENVVLHCLKLNSGKYVCRIYGREDNPKSSKTAKFLGSSLSRLMEITKIQNTDIWDVPQASIWNAKIYPVCDSMDKAVQSAISLYRIMNHKADSDEIEQWVNRERVSMKESFQMADVPAIIARQDEIEQLVRQKKCIEIIERNGQIGDAIQEIGLEADSSQWEGLFLSAEKVPFPVNMRIYMMLSMVAKKEDRLVAGRNFTELEDMAYQVICQNVIQATQGKHPFDMEKAKFCREEIILKMPVRVNFCGSPSDAAPYCLEHGGTMFDGALLLNGKKPIVVTVRRLDEKKIILESRDQDCIKTFTEIDDLRNCGDPFDSFALHKAVLVATGLIPAQKDGRTLADVCQMIGGGLKLTTSVDVPKGSGLGTSSIIAAGAVKAINQILNQNVEDDCIYAQVFLAEQLMSTGGGWQDQVGGLRGGLKYFTSKPGLYQAIHVENVQLDEKTKRELNARFALIFSGQRRLARNVLREEMNQCIRNDKSSMKAISKIREYCALMRFNLEKGDVTAFAGYVTKQFELVKTLDKGASNTCIEYIFDVCEDLIDGKSICGAGGGGFLQVILKKGVTKKQLTERMEQEFKDCGVSVWDCELI